MSRQSRKPATRSLLRGSGTGTRSEPRRSGTGQTAPERAQEEPKSRTPKLNISPIRDDDALGQPPPCDGTLSRERARAMHGEISKLRISSDERYEITSK
jgi:hypothetical protein